MWALLRTVHRVVHWDTISHTSIHKEITKHIHELYIFFAAWSFKNLLNLNDTPQSLLNSLFMYLFCVTVFLLSVHINSKVFETFYIFNQIRTDKQLWVGFYLLIGNNHEFHLHQSSMLRNLLITWLVSSSKRVPTYTSTVLSAYSILTSLEHMHAKSLVNVSTKK